MAVSSAHRPRIGYVTASDPTDRRAWSGIHYFMSKALERHCGEVHHLGPLAPRTKSLLRTLAAKTQRLTRRRYNPLHSLVLARSYARILERRIEAAKPDILFAPAGSTEIAFLRTAVPIVYLSDATFRLLHNYYPSFSNLLPVSIWEGNLIERRAIRRAAAAVFATEWAAKSALNDYGADPARVHVVPFGANLEDVPPREEALARTRSSGCRLLFVGADWPRKGGDIAYETLLELEKRGVSAELVVCGCRPPDGLTHPRLTVVPYIDKADPEQRGRLARLLSWADFFLLPTRAECSGIVFCEANAFGVPIIATDTGGVSCVVKYGRGGTLLPLSATGAHFADRIIELGVDAAHYHSLVLRGRSAFDNHLNWDTWGNRIAALMAQMLRVPHGLFVGARPPSQGPFPDGDST